MIVTLRGNQHAWGVAGSNRTVPDVKEVSFTVVDHSGEGQEICFEYSDDAISVEMDGARILLVRK